MIVTIHQPDFLPWLGFFERWQRSDLYVVLDDVQYIRRGWQHRDKIKTAQGVQWLTVPVRKKGRYLQLVNEVEIDWQEAWDVAMLKRLQDAYAKAPNLHETNALLASAFDQKHRLLMDLNLDLLKACAARLGIAKPMMLASELGGSELKSTARLIHLVKAVGGDTYLTGLGSKSYLDEDQCREAGLKVVWQDYNHPVYPQLHGDFAPMLSVIDLLMMTTASAEVFRQ